VFTNTLSGTKRERKGLAAALEFMRKGDRRLDRLGRSLKHLIETVAALHTRDTGFMSLTEQIDTTTPGGKLIFHVFGALTELERDLIRARTQAGLQAARARDRHGGRPRQLDEKSRYRRVVQSPASTLLSRLLQLRKIRAEVFRIEFCVN
jgi:DNA invertase Pin-like site-specific DNA recombinase